MEDAYTTARWKIPEDFLTRAHFERCLKRVTWTSSPGFPYCEMGYATNGAVVGWNNGEWDEAKVDMLWRSVQMRLAGTTQADDIKVVIKPEFHKVQKIEEKRYRIIASVGLIDQLIDRLLFTEQNDAEIRNWSTIPTKAGWSPFVNDGARVLRDTLLQNTMRRNSRFMAIDRKAWDWTVRGWMVELDLEFRKRMMCPSRHMEQWCQLAGRRYWELYRVGAESGRPPTWRTSDGQTFIQQFAGLQKSGCLNTLSTNSHCQVIVHALASLRSGHDPHANIPAVIGDDTLQVEFGGMERYYDAMTKLGVSLKPPVLSQDAEFAGFWLKQDGSVDPAYRSKHLIKLMYCPPDVYPETLASYQILYAWTTVYDMVTQRLFEVKPELSRSREALINRARGFESA